MLRRLLRYSIRFDKTYSVLRSFVRDVKLLKDFLLKLSSQFILMEINYYVRLESDMIPRSSNKP